MAARRVAKSAIDWAAFAERVPVNQREAFRAFKAKSDAFVAKVHRFPENLPPIDFTSYASRVSNPAMVAEFEKAYKGLNIPYPQDKNKVKADIDKQEQEAAAEAKQHIAEAQKAITNAKNLLSKIKSLPPYEEITMEMYADYFPNGALKPAERPTLWPHTKSYQPENDPHTIK
jgi:F-type H+-transporting ATPase subunit d